MKQELIMVRYGELSTKGRNKQDFIKKLAEQYREKIPYKVYEAMMNWVVEFTD